MSPDTVKGFYIICILCIYFFVKVLSGQCPPWRFGTLCRHVCYCTDGNCKKNGACEQRDLCVPGHFGDTCQFVDLLYEGGAVLLSTPIHALDWLSDNNRSTCNPQTDITKITVSWSQAESFLGFRLEVDERAKFKMPPPIEELEFDIKGEAQFAELKCNNKRFIKISNSVLDVRCSMDHPALKVEITGTILKYLCSLYVDGGRNLALISHLISSSNCTNTQLASDRSLSTRLTDCFQTSRNDNKSELTIDLHRDVIVYKVIVIFTEDPNYHPRNFVVKLQGHVTKRYEDSQSSGMSNFTVHTHPAKVISVKLKSEGADPLNYFSILVICEAMVFGECLDLNWGLECENICPEDCHRNCHPENGQCLKMCDTSTDPPCTEDASNEYTYDEVESDNVGCMKNDPCDKSTQTCPEGCKIGYYGPCCKEKIKCRPTCKEEATCKSYEDECECKEGLYGEHCQFTFPFKEKGCNCGGGACNEDDGRCRSGNSCASGWSSFYCLYHDLSKRSNIFPPVWPGYNNSMCSNNTSNSVKAMWSQVVNIAAIQIRFHKTSDVKNFSLVFSGGPHNGQCINTSFQSSVKMDVTVVDISWSFAVSATSVTVAWQGMGSVCAFKIHGGRDLTTQNITSPSLYEAGGTVPLEKYSVVDGSLSTCLTLNSSLGKLEFRFSSDVYVHEVILYKDYTENQTSTVLIQSVSSEKKEVSNLFFRIDATLSQTLHTDATFKSSLVKLQVLNGSLDLCEIEFTGECAPPRFGHGCKMTCNAGCPSGRCNYEGRCTRCRSGSECTEDIVQHTFQTEDDVLEESDSLEIEKFFLIPLIFFVVIGIADLLLYVMFHNWAQSDKNKEEDDDEFSTG